LSQNDEGNNEQRLIICRICGTVNGYGKAFCDECWSSLAAGRAVSEAEVSRHKAAGERRGRWGLWRRRVLLWLLVASLAGLLELCFFPPPPSPLPSGSTMTSSNSRPGEWATYGYDLSHTRSVAGQQDYSGRLKWRASLNATDITAPVAVGDLVFVATNDGRAIALDAVSGELRWEVQLGAPARRRAGGRRGEALRGPA